MKFQLLKWSLLFGLLFLLAVGCEKRQISNLPAMQIKLHSGVDDIARLGENKNKIQHRAKWTFKNISATGASDWQIGGFGSALFFPDVGVRVYFRNNVAVLIEIQAPFKGGILGKKLKLFPFLSGSWRDKLMQEFGPPQKSNVGGRMGAEAFYYSWGDIAFNRSGPKEIALYRDRRVVKYRQKHFGQNLELWQK